MPSNGVLWSCQHREEGIFPAAHNDKGHSTKSCKYHSLNTSERIGINGFHSIFELMYPL